MACAIHMVDASGHEIAEVGAGLHVHADGLSGPVAAGGRRVVLGLGNLLNRDEGLGVHALRELERRFDADPGVEIVDGGVLGLNLLPLVEACSHLLVLDAVDAGRASRHRRRAHP